MFSWMFACAVAEMRMFIYWVVCLFLILNLLSSLSLILTMEKPKYDNDFLVSSSLFFLVSPTSPCTPPSHQRTWMTCGWRASQAWLHPAISSARGAAPISLSHKPKLHSTSARGVPGKCFHCLFFGGTLCFLMTQLQSQSVVICL